MKIPRNMFIIWIGPNPAPIEWINSWRDKHPNWRFRVVDNNELYGRKWAGQGVIDTYLKEGRYPGVADVIRYNLLYEEGGFCAPADSLCLHNVEPLLKSEALAVYENEKVRPGLISPLYACVPKHPLAKALIDRLPVKPPRAKGGTKDRPSKAPWQTTGNAHVRRVVESQEWKGLKIVPSYRFNPIHHTGEIYKGNGKVYAVQQWSSTTAAGIGVKEYSWNSTKP